MGYLDNNGLTRLWLKITSKLAGKSDTSHTHIKSEVGLSNVDNTADANKNVWSSQIIRIPDTRNDNQPPSWYFTNYGKKTVIEFKSNSAIGISSSTYSVVTTYCGWNDSSGGYPFQIAVNNSNMYYRVGISNTAWGNWYNPYNSLNFVAGTDYAPASHTHVSANITDAATYPSSGSTKLITSGGVYTAVPKINGIDYLQKPYIYAPTTAGTSGYVLKSNGSGAPTWVSPDSLSSFPTTSSAIAYDTGRTWVGGQTIYRVDIAWIISTSSNLVNWSNHTIMLLDMMEGGYMPFSGKTIINSPLQMIGAYNNSNVITSDYGSYDANIVGTMLYFDQNKYIVQSDYEYLVVTGFIEYLNTNTISTGDYTTII